MPGEIGQALREARTRRGLELSDAERVTKIRVRYLQAMEEEQWELLPGVAYARGFLRTYAQFLGLDDEALVQEYGRRYEGEEPYVPAQELPRPPADREPRMRVPALGFGPLAGIGVVALLAILFVIGLAADTEDEPTSEVRNPPGASAPTAKGPPPTRKATSPPKKKEPAEPSQTSLELTAIGAVWVCLVDGQGKELIDGVTLASGDAKGPFEARGFRLTLGNGQVQVEVNGKDAQVPRLAEPLGYTVGPKGLQQLAAAARPTCV